MFSCWVNNHVPSRCSHPTKHLCAASVSMFISFLLPVNHRIISELCHPCGNGVAIESSSPLAYLPLQFLSQEEKSPGWMNPKSSHALSGMCRCTRILVWSMLLPAQGRGKKRSTSACVNTRKAVNMCQNPNVVLLFCAARVSEASSIGNKQHPHP